LACARHKLLLSIIQQSCAYRLLIARYYLPTGVIPLPLSRRVTMRVGNRNTSGRLSLPS
jgi:hypothetical protein